MHLIFNLSAIRRICLIPLYCGFFSSAPNRTDERRNQEKKKVHISTRNLVLRLYKNGSFFNRGSMWTEGPLRCIVGFYIIHHYFCTGETPGSNAVNTQATLFYLPANKNSALEKNKTREKKNKPNVGISTITSLFSQFCQE